MVSLVHDFMIHNKINIGCCCSQSQVYVWHSLKRFCDDNFPNSTFRNDAQRKAYLLRQGIALQPDENGVEGVAVAKSGNDDQKEIKIGKRLAASKMRQEDVSELGRDEIDKIRKKNEQGLNVAAPTQDIAISSYFHLPCIWGCCVAICPSGDPCYLYYCTVGL